MLYEVITRLEVAVGEPEEGEQLQRGGGSEEDVAQGAPEEAQGEELVRRAAVGELAVDERLAADHVITSYSIHYTKLYEPSSIAVTVTVMTEPRRPFFASLHEPVEDGSYNFV